MTCLLYARVIHGKPTPDDRDAHLVIIYEERHARLSWPLFTWVGGVRVGGKECGREEGKAGRRCEKEVSLGQTETNAMNVSFNAGRTYHCMFLENHDVHLVSRTLGCCCRVFPNGTRGSWTLLLLPPLHSAVP